MIRVILQKLHIVEGYGVFHYIIGICYSRGSVEWMPGCSPLWFLTALFVALLMYLCIDNFTHRVITRIFLSRAECVSATCFIYLKYLNYYGILIVHLWRLDLLNLEDF